MQRNPIWFVGIGLVGWVFYYMLGGWEHATGALHITFAHSVPGITFAKIGYIDVIKDLCSAAQDLDSSEKDPCFSDTWGFQIVSFLHSIFALTLIFLTGHTIRRQLRML